MSAEDQERIRQQIAKLAETTALDVANKAATMAKNLAMEAIIASLPPPVNAAAKALGEGAFAAFKVPLDAIKQPALPNEDPIKLMAFAIAFAILKAIWCFIKSLLNPLPIIGIFFPLCSDDPQITGNIAADDTATSSAKTAAVFNTDNMTLDTAKYRFTARFGPGVAFSDQLAQEIAAAQAALSIAEKSVFTPSPGTSLTFEQFVAKTATISSVQAITDTSNVTDALRTTSNQGITTANIPEQTVVEPEWQPTEKINVEPLSYEEYRKLFGL